MKIQEIEAWALRIVDAVRRGERQEHSAVELKADWPDGNAAARRVAAHANAAGGSPILWIIGIDESSGKCSRSSVDTARWWAQVSAEFDEVTPTMTDVVVNVGETDTVVALCFETDRAPYVVKNAKGGRIQREVPWREGTQLRTARRSDLVRILSPLQQSPRLELVTADLSAWHANHPQIGGENQLGPDVDWLLSATVYFIAGQGSYVAFPFRYMAVEVASADSNETWRASTVTASGTPPNLYGARTPEKVQTIHDGVQQLIVEGHGFGWLHARGHLPDIGGATPEIQTLDRLDVTITLVGVNLSGPIAVQEQLVLASTVGQQSNQLARWRTQT